MATERRIKSLKLRLKSLVTSLNLIRTFVDNYDEKTQADEVPVRLENLTKLWLDYSTAQSELETLDEAGIDTHLKERTALESNYYRVKGFLLAHNKTQSNQSIHSTTQSETQFPPSTSQVRLPDVKLPVFDGNLENWLNFHDLFVSLVHSSAGLSNIQKFFYLRSSLSNEALQLIQTIPISAHNYPVAWNLLVEHFQNNARLKQAYIDALFDYASIKKESATELHSLVEKFEANVKVLQQLGEHTEYWDILLIRMLSSQLDPTTRRDWEEYCSSKEAITFKELTSFIQRRVTVLQCVQTKPIEPQPSTVQKRPVQRSVSSHGASQPSLRQCIICSDHHPLYLCESFSSLPVEEKEKEIRRHQLCRNCLRKGHLSRDCSSSSNCRKCRGRHHTQLCSNDSSSSSNSKPANPEQPKSATPTPASDPPTTSVSATVVESISCASANHKQKTVLLATAVITLIDDNGVEHIARALLDSGSECCFITESFSRGIKAQRKKIHLPITGIGQASTQAKLKFTSTIRSRVGEYSTNIEFIVLPKVTIDLPATSIDTSIWDMPPSIQLADPSFDSTNPIDIIIGAEIFFELFKVPGRIPLGKNLPVLVNSVFGWVVTGKSTVSPPPTLIVANIATVGDIHDDDVIRPLDENLRTATDRSFQMLEGRFGFNSHLAQQHRYSIDKYLEMDRSKPSSSPTSCSTPLQTEVQDDNTTTKLRVVLNASHQISEIPSLIYTPSILPETRSFRVGQRDTPLLRIVRMPSPKLSPLHRLQLANDNRDTLTVPALILPKEVPFAQPRRINVETKVHLWLDALLAKAGLQLCYQDQKHPMSMRKWWHVNRADTSEAIDIAKTSSRTELATKNCIHHLSEQSYLAASRSRGSSAKILTSWLPISLLDRLFGMLEKVRRTSAAPSSSPTQSSFVDLFPGKLSYFQLYTPSVAQQQYFINEQDRRNQRKHYDLALISRIKLIQHAPPYDGKQPASHVLPFLLWCWIIGARGWPEDSSAGFVYAFKIWMIHLRRELPQIALASSRKSATADRYCSNMPLHSPLPELSRFISVQTESKQQPFVLLLRQRKSATPESSFDQNTHHQKQSLESRVISRESNFTTTSTIASRFQSQAGTGLDNRVAISSQFAVKSEPII